MELGDFLQEMKVDKNGKMFLSNGGDAVSFLIALDDDGRLLWDYYFRDSDYNHFFVTKHYIYLISTYKQTNQLLLLDKDTGKKKEEITLELDDDEYIQQISTDYDGKMYVTTGKHFIIFEKDGDLERQFNIEIPYDMKPVIGPNGIIYILGQTEKSNQYRLYAIRSRGSIKWSTPLTFDGFRFTSERHQYPILFDKKGTLYIKDEFTVYSINPANGKVYWRYALDDEQEEYRFLLESDQDYLDDINRNRSPYLVKKLDDTVILMSNYEMIALDEDDGDEEWYFDRGIYPILSVIEQNKKIYTLFDRLYSLDEDGDVKWSYDLTGQGIYINADLQVDHDGYIYLNEYKYGSNNSTLTLFDPYGEVQWKSQSLPVDNHDWYMTKNGPIYVTYSYQNGRYASELYVINKDQMINNVKVDGVVEKVIEKGHTIYVLTSNKLYAFLYLYAPSGIKLEAPKEAERHTSDCYMITNNIKRLPNGYQLNIDWNYAVDKKDYDLKITADQDDNVYLSLYDGDQLAYLYSINSKGKLNWRYREKDEAINGFLISDNYLHLYDSDDENIQVIVLHKDTGREYRSFSHRDVDHILVDPDGNTYLSSADGLVKYNKYGRKVWQLNLNIPDSTKPVIGPDGSIYALSHLYGEKYRLYAVQTNGKKRWNATLTFEDFHLDEKESPVLFDEDGTLYLLNDDDHTLYVIDPNSGAIRFKHVAEEDVKLLLKLKKDDRYFENPNLNPWVVDKINDHIVLQSKKEVYALNADTGKIEWRFKNNQAITDMKEQDEILYVLSDHLYGINKYGYHIWTYPLNGENYPEKNLIMNQYGSIYVTEYTIGNRDGIIHEIDKYGNRLWQIKNSTYAEQVWYLAKKAPVYTTYQNYSDNTSLNTLNDHGLIIQTMVDGKVLEVLDDKDRFYVLTNEKLYAFTHSYEYGGDSALPCNEEIGTNHLDAIRFKDNLHEYAIRKNNP